jgi:hypothetical protein
MYKKMMICCSETFQVQRDNCILLERDINIAAQITGPIFVPLPKRPRFDQVRPIANPQLDIITFDILDRILLRNHDRETRGASRVEVVRQ